MSKEKRKLLGCIDIPGEEGEQIGAYDFDLWFGFRSCCFFLHCFVFDTIPIQAPPSHLICLFFCCPAYDERMFFSLLISSMILSMRLIYFSRSFFPFPISNRRGGYD